ncbi:hypothetical protein G8J22_02416 [Lentilactobacillus hilgardii]|nr:hypothetical protein HMPREF0497_1590 [Lentilactobacillus buchneri ATCC 11577]QIR10408.1 hypothetical protein G8J22_02416 [Lentilactobacillus hilgardii]
MQITVAPITEQGISFSVVLMKPSFQLTSGNMEALNFELPADFPRPIIVARELGSSVEFFGRNDIVNFLSNLDLSQIPWQTFDVQ